MAGGGFVGGYGIYSKGNLAISAYLTTHLRQTNNIAEIYAALQTLKLFSTGKVAVCTDSSLVLLGATRRAKKWALKNWVGSRGPLSNIKLWKELLTEIEFPHCTVKWIKVPSHVGIQGNEEALAPHSAVICFSLPTLSHTRLVVNSQHPLLPYIFHL